MDAENDVDDMELHYLQSLKAHLSSDTLQTTWQITFPHEYDQLPALQEMIVQNVESCRT